MAQDFEAQHPRDVGGKFTDKYQSEANVALDDNRPARISGFWHDLTLDQPEVLACLQRAAHRAGGGSTDPDEVLSDLCEEWLQTVARSAESFANGEPPRQVDSVAAMAGTMARAIASRSDGGSDARLRWARTAYRIEHDQAEQRLGRHLTSDEQDDLAEEIVSRFDGHRKPQAQFHRQLRDRHIQRVGGPGSEDDGVENSLYRKFEAASIVGRAPTSMAADFEPGSAPDRLRDSLDGGGRSAQRRARNDAYDALASTGGAPPARHREFSEHTAAKLRRQIESAGGVTVLAEQWRTGTISDNDRKLLFSPFEVNSPAGEEQVVSVLDKAPSYAADVWDGAVSKATNRR